jgi:hypothetical protein
MTTQEENETMPTFKKVALVALLMMAVSAILLGLVIVGMIL